MHPLLLSSDFDPFQMAIIVIAVLAGFVKWLWESWQQKAGAPPVPPKDPEEQRRREAAWRKQTGQPASSPPPPLPPVAAPSAWDELRKAWKELQETAKPAPVPASRPAQPPRTPPPLRQQQSQRVRQQPQPARSPAPQPPPVVAVMKAPDVEVAPVAVVTSKPAVPEGSILANLRDLRRDPALMRQAILMQEILGPPKALQSTRDFAI